MRSLQWTFILALAIAQLVHASALDSMRIVKRHSNLLARSTGETHVLAKRGGFRGKATFYGMNDGDKGACGDDLDPNQHIVALNQVQYGDLDAVSKYCGKTIRISCNGKSTTAKIVDACPTGEQCHYGALDMSKSLFKYFHELDIGVFTMEWSFVDEDDPSKQAQSHKSGHKGQQAADPGKKQSQKKKQQNEQAAKDKQKAAMAQLAALKAAQRLKLKQTRKVKTHEESLAPGQQQGTNKQNIASFSQLKNQLNNMLERAHADGLEEK